MKRAIGMSAMALLALAACQKKTETAASGTAAPAAVTAPSGAGGGLQAPPPRKPGLWDQTVSTAQMQQSTKICLGAATDKQMAWWGSQAARSNCAEQTITPHAGGGWDFHSVCTSPDSGTTTSDGTASGDFSAHYRVDVTSTSAGGPMPQANGIHKISIEATWRGPCPADMRAGDMDMPGGMRINVKDTVSGKGPPMAAGPHAPDATDIARMRAQPRR